MRLPTPTLVSIGLLAACAAPPPSRESPPAVPTGDTQTRPHDTHDTGEEPSWFVVPPTLALPSATTAVVGGARHIEVQASRATSLTVTLTGPEGVRTTTWPAGFDHDVPLVGLRPDVDYTVELALEDDDGARQAGPKWAVRGDPYPADAPQVDRLPVDDARPVGGHTLFAASAPGDRAAWALLLDEEGIVVWWARLDTALGDLRLTDDGTLLGVGEHAIVELDWLGHELWHGASGLTQPPEAVRLGVFGVHHDVVPLDDGTLLTLDTRFVTAPAYPVTYDDLETFEPADILSSSVVRIDRLGDVVHRVNLEELLPTSHIGFGSLESTPLVPQRDWAHANAVTVDEDGSWVVHLRHLDALVKLGADDRIQWILGDPAGWPSSHHDLLLQGRGSLSWPYHAHAPELHRDSDGLWVLLFDNHNEGHTPYTDGPDEQPPSRLVAYRVDEGSGTVRQAWEHTVAYDGPLYSHALGDADQLADGTVLGVWGMLREEGGRANADHGRGDLTARLVQIDPVTGERTLDLRVRSDRATSAAGFSVYRAERLPTLHPKASVSADVANRLSR